MLLLRGYSAALTDLKYLLVGNARGQKRSDEQRGLCECGKNKKSEAPPERVGQAVERTLLKARNKIRKCGGIFKNVPFRVFEKRLKLADLNYARVDSAFPEYVAQK